MCFLDKRYFWYLQILLSNSIYIQKSFFIGETSTFVRKYDLIFFNILQNNLWDFFTDFQYYTKLFQTFTAIQNGCT